MRTIQDHNGEASAFRRICDALGRTRSQLDMDRPTSDMPVRQQVIAAAITRLTQEPFQVIAKGLNPSRFESWIPGLRSKMVRQFDSSDNLAREVLKSAVSADRSSLTDHLIIEATTALAQGEMSHDEIIEQLGGSYFNSICDDPALVLQTYAWLAARNTPELRAGFVELYDSLEDRVEGAMAQFFEHWGRKPDGPLELREITVVLTCLLEGLAVRAAVMPDAVPPDLAMRVVLALVKALTVPIDDPSQAENTTT